MKVGEIRLEERHNIDSCNRRGLLWLLLIAITLFLFLTGTYYALRKTKSEMDFANGVATSVINIDSAWNPIQMQPYQRLNGTILLLFSAAALVSILSFVISALFMRRNNLLLATLVQQRTTELAQANVELRAAKERVEGTLAAIPDVIIQTNESGIITAANNNAEVLLGYTHQELIGLEVEKLIPERLRERHMHEHQRMMATCAGSIKSLSHLIVLDKNGHEIDVEINVNIFEMGGEWVAIASVRDIRDRLNAEREKEKLQQQLILSNKKKTIGQLTGGIAHDFNNILTSIMGFAELAAHAAPAGNNKLAHYIEAIQQSSRRASELVKQMIAFSRGDTEPIPVFQEEGIRSSLATATFSSNISHHLMIVDDEKSITTFMAELFKEWGYRVSTFNSAIEALIAFEQNPQEFDLVITDQTMPQMMGTDLIGSLQNIRPGIPVILYSGYNDEVDKEDYHHQGIRTFISKPLDTGVLHQAVKQQLA